MDNATPNVLRQTLQSIPDLLAQAEADMVNPLTRDLAVKIEYLRDELLAEVEGLTPEEMEKHAAAAILLDELAMLVVEVVKIGRTRAALVAFSAAYNETFTVFVRRIDERSKYISLPDILVACMTQHSSREVDNLLRNWGLRETFQEVLLKLEIDHAVEEAVCEVSLDLI
jgi:hypothetical protein